MRANVKLWHGNVRPVSTNIPMCALILVMYFTYGGTPKYFPIQKVNEVWNNRILKCKFGTLHNLWHENNII
jgi:hypothetical protein